MNTEERKALLAHIETFLAALPPFAWAVAFVSWAFTPNRKELPALFTGAALCLLGALATIHLISAFRKEIHLPADQREKPFVPKSRLDNANRRHPTGWILLIAFFSRILLIGALYLLDRKAAGGYAGGIFERISLWRNNLLTSPAGRLIGSSPDAILQAVGPGCFPLFPLLSGLIAPAFPEPFFAGMVLSNLFTVIAAPLLYEFTLPDGLPKDARRAVALLLFSPIALVSVYANEASMVLVFGLAALILSRRGKPFFSALFLLVAILTHPLSALLIIPCVWDRLREIAAGKALGLQKSFLANLLALTASMAAVIGLAIPALVCEAQTGSLPRGITELSLIPFFEEATLRFAKLWEALPADSFGRLRGLIPVMLPALPLGVVLFASSRLRPKYGVALLMSVFSLSLISCRDIFPMMVASPVLLSGLSAIGRRPIIKILVALSGVGLLVLFTIKLGAGIL